MTVNVQPPQKPVRLVFLHHSCGNNWLNDDNGGLGAALGKNNYCVRDTYYKWDATENPDIGSSTDIGHWFTWFADTTVQKNGIARRDNIMASVYQTNNQHAQYSPIADPGGENEIIMFKSCYPNSAVKPDNGFKPEDLFGQPFKVEAHTLSNCKVVYRRIVEYFKSRPNKLFVVITAPPLVPTTDAGQAKNARALNNWLVNDWLKESNSPVKNVCVFDLYNVLTHPDNHHRMNARGTAVEHISKAGDDFSAYGQGTDSHPTADGNRKAAIEFVPYLNYRYNIWKTK